MWKTYIVYFSTSNTYDDFNGSIFSTKGLFYFMKLVKIGTDSIFLS